jgi:hypothetical protein
MHRDGHIVLPAPQRPANNHLKKPKVSRTKVYTHARGRGKSPLLPL